jgi:hypothetical protein
LNHFTRCADEPWVKVSGLTRRPAIFCRRSSPMAWAAVTASSMSPTSMRLRRPVSLAHTPA